MKRLTPPFHLTKLRLKPTSAGGPSLIDPRAAAKPWLHGKFDTFVHVLAVQARLVSRTLAALAETVLVSTVFTVAVAIAANVHAAPQQVSADERQALRSRVAQQYDVVPLSGGVALRPKSPRGDVRLIEISDTIAINGVPVSGRELRERVGADADAIQQASMPSILSWNLIVTNERALSPRSNTLPSKPS